MASLLQRAFTRPENEFDRALAREILSNEIRRVVLVLVLTATILALLLIVRLFDPDLVFVHGNHRPLEIGILAVALFVTYESVVLVMMLHVRKIEHEPPMIARYANALVETSLPTLVIYIFSGITTGPEALFSPPSYAYFLFILLSTLRLNFAIPLFTGLVAALGYAFMVVLFQDELTRLSATSMLRATPVHVAKIVFYFLGGVMAGLVSQGIRRGFERTLHSVQERNQIREIFGKHVSPEVVDKLLSQQSEADSETRHVCVMFLDIRDFTTFSESRTPEEVVEYLNTIFDFMIDIINEHRGIVNKFLGDGFMAVFGAPLSDGIDSQNALSAARKIIEEVNRRSTAGEIPKTRVGIGLHAGEAVTGNVGSRTRREYTIIGDTVNVASRIEALNKRFSSQLLISETVRGSIESGGHEPPGAEELEPLQVKGRTQPVQVYKVV